MVPNITQPHEAPNINTFGDFYERWLTRLEQHLQELVQCIQCNSNEENEPANRDIIIKVLAHYTEYYEAKVRVAQDNVFVLFSPTWLSPFEQSYLWITGFRPGLALSIATASLMDLSEGQFGRLKSLMAEIKEEEKELTDSLSKVQEDMASPFIVTLARNAGEVKNGEVGDLETAMDRLAISMDTLVECADYLRMKTVTHILEILTSTQTLQFLASVAQFQLSVHRYGKNREAQVRRHSPHDG